MKRYAVSVRFHNALVKDSIQHAMANGGNLRVAVSRALQEILRRPGIKGRRHTRLVISVVSAGNGATAQEVE